MIKKHYSLEHADKILNKIFNILGRSDDDNDAKAYVCCWSNCREQGYFIKCWATNRGVCFAQQRNSEQIVVIHGSADIDFDITTNMPRNWDKYSCFNNDDEAVAHIIDKLGIIDEMVAR